MNKKLQRFAASFLTSLGTIWLVVETLKQDLWTVLAIYSLTAAVITRTVLQIVRGGPNSFTEAVDRFLSRTGDAAHYVVDCARGESDLRKVAKLDQSEYGEDSVEFAGLRSWWKRYRKGVFLLRKGPQVVGAFGIWPIKKTVYQELIQGRRHEQQISSKSICGREDSVPYIHWYIGDIIYDRNLRLGRKDAPIHILLEGALRNWLDSGDVAPQISVCALGVRESNDSVGEGERLLLNFGFEPVAEIPSIQDTTKVIPVYARQVTREELDAIYQDVRGRLDNLIRHRQRRRALSPVIVSAMQSSDVG